MLVSEWIGESIATGCNTLSHNLNVADNNDLSFKFNIKII